MTRKILYNGKEKFDHINGEHRTCIRCNAAFYATKPIRKCKQCANQAGYDTRAEKIRLGIIVLEAKKPPYPFNITPGATPRRFNQIRTRLSNAWKAYRKTGDKSIITNHYDAQLKEIEENGIMQWITDRRTAGQGDYRELPVKSRKIIHKEYPNHHDTYEY